VIIAGAALATGFGADGLGFAIAAGFGPSALAGVGVFAAGLAGAGRTSALDIGVAAARGAGFEAAGLGAGFAAAGFAAAGLRPKTTSFAGFFGFGAALAQDPFFLPPKTRPSSPMSPQRATGASSAAAYFRGEE